MHLKAQRKLSHSTGLGMRKPENKFQKDKKKDMTTAAIWWLGVKATTIIPYMVK